MGWRVTAANLNLNRDFAKADAVEMQAWLRAWVAWQPDLLFDNHTTNGSDHQYVLLYATTLGHFVAAPIATWVQTRLLPEILPALAADGHLAMPYGGPRDPRDPSQGIHTFSAGTPRYSTGYAAVCNRPALLVEAHALKPYAQRVRATYDIMLHALEELNRRPDALRAAIRAADHRTIAARGAGPGGHAVQQQRTDASQPFVYKGVEVTTRQSGITGGEVVSYTARPRDVESRIYKDLRISKSVNPPAAYLVPPQWAAVVDRLALHGVEFFRLVRPEQLDVESYRFEDVSFASRPYEGRMQPRYKTIPLREPRAFVAGTVVVPLAQQRAKVAIHLLEPEAPDALLRWGLLNGIFERKEYAESYVMEPIARKMLAEDPALQREFEQKLADDEKFAASPRARLDFFYRRSPYWDEQFNIYPIARLVDEDVLARLQREAR